ncbi:S-layer homology region domain protein [Candidatus Magnetoovum chiemensis]|nr:S-layer homology region domain protein [Candidatus Magnetoovum chiemensis]
MTIAGETFTITQDPCTYSIQPETKSFTYTGGVGFVTINTSEGCTWEAVSNDLWLSLMSGTSGAGSGQAIFAVETNDASASRTGTLTIAGETFTVTQSATDCEYSISPSKASYSTDGGAGTIEVSSSTGCEWTPEASDDWISITSGSSGNGIGTITYTVNSNSGFQRGGKIEIMGEEVDIVQAGDPCVYDLMPKVGVYTSQSGSGSVDVITSLDTCAWTAVSDNSWITIDAGSNGTGNAAVSYSVSENPNTSPRIGILEIAGRKFTVTQTGADATCSVSILPQQTTISSESTEGNIIVLTSPADCAWSTTTVASSWIAISDPESGSGTGDSVITYKAEANADTSDRFGVVMVNDQPFMLTQKGVCTYDLSPVVIDIDAAGSASETVAVTPSDSICTWNAISDEDWITVVSSSSSGTGTGTVEFAVAANSTGAMRTGKVVIGGQNLLIVQLSEAGKPFDDIDSEDDTFQNAINAMKAYSITEGCDAQGNYCPEGYVNRAQMAVFVLKAAGQAPSDSDTCTGAMFNDVTTETLGDYFCKAIEKFASLNITAGCGDGNFCPDGYVTRAQMAVFMLKGLGQGPNSSDKCKGTELNDITTDKVGEYFCKAIEKFRDKNITTGCSVDDPLTTENEAAYCPDDNVKRSQMALFLTKGFLSDK